MKRYFYLLITLCVPAAILLYGCNPANKQDNLHSKTANFPCLTIRIDTVSKWLTSTNNDSKKPFSQFVFVTWNASSKNSWQLICYGQHDMPDSLDFHPLSVPFSVYDSFPKRKEKFDSTDMAYGNLQIDTSVMKTLVDSATKGAMKYSYLLFAPDVSAKHFKHLTYRIYLYNADPASGRIITTYRLSKIFPASGPVKVYNDGENDYIELNPCPPAHVDTH